MAQSCFLGAEAFEASEAKYAQWLNDWCSLPLGGKCKLPLCCASQFEALIDTVSLYNEQSWMPRRSSVPLQTIVFLCLDSAGLSDEDPTSARACGGWMFSSSWPQIRWYQETWHPDVLQVAHSTVMEAANGISCLDHAMHTIPAQAYIEIYDSASSVDIFRSMSSRSVPMRMLLQARFNLLTKFPEARALPLWQNRTDGFIAGARLSYCACTTAPTPASLCCATASIPLRA